MAIATTLGIPRSRFYPRKPKQKQSVNSSRSQQPTDQEIRNALRNLDHRYYLYGYRRLCALFRQQFGWVINHKRMRRILASMKWNTKRIARIKHQYKRIEKPSQPNQVWQMDMTKFFIDGLGWVNVIAVIDAYTREVVGHHITLRARSQEWLEALNQAVNKRFPLGIREMAPSLTLQVDNGCQPTSHSFVNTVKRCSINLAFTAIATPEHNAIIERFFRTLKEECIWPNLFESFDEAVREIGDYIHFYNSERIHSALGYLSPESFVIKETLLKTA